MLFREEITDYFKSLQNAICQSLEAADDKGRFIEDAWKRPEGGGGRTRVLKNGNVIEKGGVAFSAVHGALPEFLKKELWNNDEKKAAGSFYATGVSIVLHPLSPMVPIIHMNVRYFEAEMNDGEKKELNWFGGGIDLTPHYVSEEDARYFHQQLKNTCNSFHPDYYPEFKKWADDYFFIRHRNETRGVGGIFFDKLTETNTINIGQRYEFVKAVGELFAPVYVHFMNKNKNLPYGESEKKWQRLRRGRYAEFNLVLDRGTKFGLETNGRTESILMSLPPQADWEYNYQPAPGTKEHETLQLLKKGINW